MFRVTYVNVRRSIADSKMTEHEIAIPDLPSKHSIDRLVSVLEPVSRIVQPQLYGVENDLAVRGGGRGGLTPLPAQFPRDPRDLDPNRGVMARLRRRAD